jgi:hypothetical protein
VIDALKKKYEAAVRAKALMALERDKLRAMVGRPYHMCTWIPLTHVWRRVESFGKHYGFGGRDEETSSCGISIQFISFHCMV